jgi:hypothetical protein
MIIILPLYENLKNIGVESRKLNILPVYTINLETLSYQWFQGLEQNGKFNLNQNI